MSDVTTTPLVQETVLRDSTHFRIPSQPDWIEPTVDYLKERALLCGACKEGRAGKVIIALHEALTNAMVHGNLEISSELKELPNNEFARALSERSGDERYGGRLVTIEMDYDGDACQWTITDQGPGFDVERYLSQEEPSPEEMFLASGRGILLMRAFLDDVQYHRGGSQVVLTLLRNSGIDRRQHPRREDQRAVRVAPISSQGQVDWELAQVAVSQDVSEQGMRLLLAELTQSEQVQIGIETKDGIKYVPANVRHCREVSAGWVEIGCQFHAQVNETAPLEKDSVELEIEEVLAELRYQQDSWKEKRTFLRENYTEPIEIHHPSKPEIIQGVGRNLSKGGMAFITSEPIPLETLVLSLPKQGRALRIRAEIVRCTQIHQSFYDVGARFLSIQENVP